MPNGKPRRPKLTPNQEAWRKEERRIKQILYRMEKAGFKFSREELLPTRPTKITKQSIERLKATTPAILRGYAKVPEGFKGKIETQKSKRKATYLTARGNGQGIPASKPDMSHLQDYTKTEKATETRQRNARERAKAKHEGEIFRQKHMANAMAAIVANVEAELTSGPYDDVSSICLEKFRSLLQNKPNFLFNNMYFAADSLIEAAHIVSYESEQDKRIQYGHLFMILIYGGNIPKSVSKELLSLTPYGMDEYDTAWETEAGIEMEKQARAPGKGGRPTKIAELEKKEHQRFLNNLAQQVIDVKEQQDKLDKVRKEVGLKPLSVNERETELNIINDSLEAFDPTEWDMKTTEEQVTSKSGIDYVKKKVVLVNKVTGEIVD